MKTCSVCGEQKPTKDFPIYSKVCKQCKNEKTRKWKVENREWVKSYSKEYRESNKDRISALMKKFHSIHPNAHNAEEKIRRRILWGEIKVPPKCQDCGKKSKLHAHHYLGYDKEHELDVMFLCQSCHQLKHRREKESDG